MPSLPIESNGSVERELIDEIKMVADYCNSTFSEALELPCDLFALSLKKAFILRLKSSEEGRELLKLAEYMKRTDCDLDMLMEFCDDEE